MTTWQAIANVLRVTTDSLGEILEERGPRPVPSLNPCTEHDHGPCAEDWFA